METIYFTKKFLTGNLKGLCVPGKLSKESVDACAKAIHIGKKGSDCITKSKWIVVDCSFQNYHR